jgi:hypothetical protein
MLLISLKIYHFGTSLYKIFEFVEHNERVFEDAMYTGTCTGCDTDARRAMGTGS